MSRNLGGGTVQRSGDVPLLPAGVSAAIEQHEARVAGGEGGVHVGDVGLQSQSGGEEGNGNGRGRQCGHRTRPAAGGARRDHRLLGRRQSGPPRARILAFVRLRYPSGNYKPVHDLVATTPEIIEAHHVTGEDCFVLKVVARSMRHLERTTGRIAGLGSVTTTVVYSSILTSRAITAAVLTS